MDIQKIFAEIGRMHLEIMELRDQLAATQAQLAVYAKAPQVEPPPSVAVSSSQ